MNLTMNCERSKKRIEIDKRKDGKRKNKRKRNLKGSDWKRNE